MNISRQEMQQNGLKLRNGKTTVKVSISLADL